MDDNKAQKTDSKHSEQYLDDLKEWQEHQYNPSHWIGDKTPPHIKYGGRKLGMVYLIIGALILALGIFSLLYNESGKILSSIIYWLVGILIILVGLKKSKKTERS